MLKEQTGSPVELSHQATRKHLEQEYCELVNEIHQTIQRSSLDQFMFPLIDSLWHDLNTVLYGLERMPETTFKELIEVTVGIREARNELRLARFLFDLEEVDPIRRFVMRNKAALRGKTILQRVLLVWPLYSSVEKT